MIALVSASAFALAGVAWISVPDAAGIVRLRLGLDLGGRTGGGPAMLALLTLVMLWVVPGSATRLALAASAAAGWFGLRLRRNATKRATARDFSIEVAQVIRTLAGEVRAGVSPGDGLRTVSAEASMSWQPLLVASAVDIPDTLRMLARQPGGNALDDVAAAWEIADRSGARLSGILQRVADSIQSDVDVEREVALEASPARATGRFLAFLPVFGLLLGTLLGAHPVRVLFATWPGAVCLCVGLTLSSIGMWWIERIVTTAEEE